MNKKLIWGIAIVVVLVIVIVVLIMENNKKSEAAKNSTGTKTTNTTTTTGSKPKGTVLPFDQVPRMVAAPTKGSKFVLDGTTYEFDGAQWLAI